MKQASLARMNILALETATEACSAALQIDDDVITRFEIAPRKHTQRLLPMINEIMAEAGCLPTQLDGIAFGRGPGAFTGVRIATGVVQGMALGLDIPVVPVSTLAAMAQGAYRLHQATRVISAIDARMNEVYWAGYAMNDEQMNCVIEEGIYSAEAAVFTNSGTGDLTTWLGVGSGWAEYHERLLARPELATINWSGDFYPDAQDVLTLAIRAFANNEAVTVDEVSPVYLRDKVV